MSKGTLTVRVVGDAKPFEQTMGKLGGVAKAAFAAVGAAAAVGAVKSLGAFTKFEGQMNEVFTLLPDISGDAMADMTAQTKDFAKEFGVLPDKVVPALYQSLSAGVPKDNVFEFLEVAQKAAKGGVTELATAVDGISSVVNAYGDDVIDAAEASDLMFTAVRLGKTNFEQLSASLSNVTPIASGLGVKFDDVSAALAAMTAKGTPTAQATTQLRSLFVELSKAGGKTAKTFEDIAGKSFQDFIAEGGNTADALDLMKRAADDSDVQLQDLFGSVEAGAAALSLASGTTFHENIDEMGRSAGATNQAFDRMMKGLGPMIDRAKAWAAVLLIDIGQKLAPVIEAAMARIAEGFALVSAWWDENGPAIMTKIGEVRDAIMGWIDEVRPAIESWVTNVLASITEWWEANGPTVISLVEDLRAGIVDAVDLIVDAIQLVVEEWDKFKVAIGVAVAIMIPHFVALGVAAVASSVKQVAAWVAGNAAAIGAAVIHSAQVAIMVGKWIVLAATATAQAAVVAAAWVISMGPIAAVVLAVAGVAAAFILHWDTIKNAVLVGVQFVVDKFLWLVEKVVGAAADAFGWVPGVGDKLKKAEQAVATFRENVNNELDAIRQGDIIVKLKAEWDIPQPPIRSNMSNRGGGLSGVFHTGGVVHADRPGGEAFIIVRDGERVSTPTDPGGGGMPDPDEWGRRAADAYGRRLQQLARVG